MISNREKSSLEGCHNILELGIEINHITLTILFSYKKKYPPLKPEDFECFWCIEMDTPGHQGIEMEV